MYEEGAFVFAVRATANANIWGGSIVTNELLDVCCAYKGSFWDKDYTERSVLAEPNRIVTIEVVISSTKEGG